MLFWYQVMREWKNAFLQYFDMIRLLDQEWGELWSVYDKIQIALR